MSYYRITNSQPLLEKMVIDVPNLDLASNGDNGADDVDVFFGGTCFPMSIYEVSFQTPRTQIWRFRSVFDISFQIGNPTVTIFNKNQIAADIAAALSFSSGIEAEAEIEHESFGGNVIYKLIITTNAPLGVIKFRNASGNFNDPNNIEVTGFTKV